MNRVTCVLLLSFVLAGCVKRPALNLNDFEVVDLTHAFNEDTIYWPNSPTTFEKQQLYFGETPGGWFYSANAICAPEHGGTHLDAPIHFYEDRDTADRVPLEKLMGPAVVIDVSAECRTQREYRLTAEKVLEFEAAHGLIAPGSLVLLRTGWSDFWPRRKQYLGDDTPGVTDNLRFPSYGADAAELLVNERNVALLGVDTASIDYGQSQDFLVHRIAAEQNVPGLENLTNLDHLPPTGASIIALPMKIEDGSGGPVRVVALVPKR